MTDVCFSKPEILITLAWIEITTKFGLLVDIDLLQKTGTNYYYYYYYYYYSYHYYYYVPAHMEGAVSFAFVCLSVRPSRTYRITRVPEGLTCPISE